MLNQISEAFKMAKDLSVSLLQSSSLPSQVLSFVQIPLDMADRFKTEKLKKVFEGVCPQADREQMDSLWREVTHIKDKLNTESQKTQQRLEGLEASINKTAAARRKPRPRRAPRKKKPETTQKTPS